MLLPSICVLSTIQTHIIPLDSVVVNFVGSRNIFVANLKPPQEPKVLPLTHQSPLLFLIPMPFVPGSLPMQPQPRIQLQISEGIMNVRLYTYQMNNGTTNKDSSVYLQYTWRQQKCCMYPARRFHQSLQLGWPCTPYY